MTAIDYVPAAETEFARDATFGYSARTLPGWVEEKTHHRITTRDVASLTVEEIRRGGPERVAERLRDARHGQPVVVNALDYPDLWTVVLGLLQAEAEGKRFVYRTGASFVRARAGIDARPLLTRDELLGTERAATGARLGRRRLSCSSYHRAVAAGARRPRNDGYRGRGV